MLCVACTATPQQRLELAHSLKQNYSSGTLETSVFKLWYVSIDQDQSEPLRIMIEGDGFAWVGWHTPSDNPTPLNPVGLRLATKLGADYIARPCQYVQDPSCHMKYWTSHRFAPEVFQSYHYILDQIKVEKGVKSLHLMGFSGGGYIALNLAMERDDVVELTTYHSPLDIDAWTDYHDVSRVVSRKLTNTHLIPMTHWCSEDDAIVPCSLTFQAKDSHDYLKRSSIKALSGIQHDEIWQAIDP